MIVGFQRLVVNQRAEGCAADMSLCRRAPCWIASDTTNCGVVLSLKSFFDMAGRW